MIPKKQLNYKEFYDLAVISYQVRTHTLNTKLHHSVDKENLIKANENI